jgi:type II secretion system protein I
MKQRPLYTSDGMTILEVLVAIIVLSVALLLLMNMTMVALEGNDWSNNTTLATQLMQEKLEQLRSQADFGLLDGTDTVSGVVRSWSVSTADSYLRRVDVQARWQDVKSQTRTSTMSAYIRTDSL